MNLVLTERTCKVCKGKLAEFEIKNNGELCIDCFKEKSEKTTSKAN